MSNAYDPMPQQKLRCLTSTVAMSAFVSAGLLLFAIEPAFAEFQIQEAAPRYSISTSPFSIPASARAMASPSPSNLVTSKPSIVERKWTAIQMSSLSVQCFSCHFS